MDIIVNGLFDLSKDRTYVIVNSHRSDVGTLEIKKEEYFIKVGDEKKRQVNSEEEIKEFLESHNYILATESWRWHEYNPNPKKNKATDCTIRAYCAAQKLDWEFCYDMACDMGKEMSLMPNDDKCVHAIMEERFEYEYVKKDKEDKDLTVKQFAISHPDGVYVLNVARHIVAVVDGEYYDSWDSGDKKVKGWWQRGKKKNEDED